MKICPNCNTQNDDNSTFCVNCGAQLDAQQYTQNTVPPAQYAPVFDPYDHTADFDLKDISDNKVFAMLGYLLGTIGIVVALIGGRSSDYAMFHIKQALRFTIVDVLMLICTALLFWTIIVPIAYAVMVIVFLVIRIICFFQVCSGKAKEAAIIRNLSFLK